VALLGLLFVALLGSTARGDELRLSISGYDPVAYFTDGRPVQGKAEFEYVWRRLRWRFADGEHRDLFVRDPQRYAPQYDGYCAMGAAEQAAAHKDTVDPEAWAIVHGKLYLVHTGYWLERWREQAAEYIGRPTRTGESSQIFRTRSSLDPPVLPPRPQIPSRCATGGVC